MRGFTATRLASQQFVNPVPLHGKSYTPDVSTVSSIANTVTVTSGAANTKGSWATIDSSTAVDASTIHLTAPLDTSLSGQDYHMLMDFAIGPSGGPTILVNNLQVGLLRNQNTPHTWALPFRVPAGTELIARIQCATASVGETFSVELVEDQGGYPAFSHVETIGANTSTSQGVALATPAANNTKGAWTEIVASTSTYIRALTWGIGFDWQPGFSSVNYLYDIAYGDSGTETILFENLVTRSATTESQYGWLPTGHTTPVAVNLPAGSRIAARYQAHAFSSGRDINLCLYGWS